MTGRSTHSASTIPKAPPLRAVEIRHRYGDRIALDGVSLEVRAGEILCVLGHNGAGKSSLVEILVGLRQPDSGRRECQDPERIGYAPQALAIWPDMTATEQLEFLGMVGAAKKTRTQARHDGIAILEELGLESRQDDLAARLSGGMQRRLHLALACTGDPHVLVLDEPTLGLDPRSRSLVHTALRGRVSGQSQTGILLCTHDLDEAFTLADEIAILDRGRIRRLAPPSHWAAAVGPGSLEAELLSHAAATPAADAGQDNTLSTAPSGVDGTPP